MTAPVVGMCSSKNLIFTSRSVRSRSYKKAMSIEMKRSWNNEVENIQAKTKENMQSNNSRDNSGSRKKSKSDNNEAKTNKPPRKPVEMETDLDILQRRQKQIDYGKNTTGYYNYTQQVPIAQRTKNHPKTPDKYTKYSRRSWDMLIKLWRKQLHEYDTADGENCHNYEEDEEGSIVSGSSND